MALKTQINQITAEKFTGYTYEGKPIYLTRQSGRPQKLKRHNKKWWPEEKKIEVATLWPILRNANQIRELTDVPVGTIKKWTEEGWFQQIVEKVKKDKNEVLDAKITQALDKAIDVVNDRLENGDYYLNRKTGEMVRTPIKLRDVSGITGTLFDKRQIIRNAPTSISESVTTDQKLKALKDNFENLAKSVGINPKKPVIDEVEYEIDESEDGDSDEWGSGSETEEEASEHDSDQETVSEEEGEDVNAIQS